MKKVRTLLVEDNPADVFLFEQGLADDLGEFTVSAVGSLGDAVELMSREAFDLIVSDLGLPDEEGIAVVDRLRDRAPDVPIVVLTGRDDENLGLQALRAGAQDWLTKGQITGRALARSLRYALARQETERLRVKQEQLQEVSRQLWNTAKLATMGELAAGIAHELNNPLAIVSLRIEELLAQTRESDARRRALEIISGEVDRMAQLVARLLDSSRRSTQQISTVDLCAEIEGAVELVGYHLRSHQISVQREFGLDVPPVHADRQQVRQVLLNLFMNASDAMAPGGTLTVRIHFEPARPAQTAPERPTRRESYPSLPAIVPARVIIEVVDTGGGIAPDDLARVTEPFFTTKPEGQGTGLGLAICQRILDEHHGSLQIESELGRGTTVRLEFPNGQ